jgi:hypothetical protein
VFAREVRRLVGSKKYNQVPSMPQPWDQEFRVPEAAFLGLQRWKIDFIRSSLSLSKTGLGINISPLITNSGGILSLPD